MNFNNFSLHIGSGLFASQAVDVFGGLCLLLIGAAIFHTLVSWRFRGLQVDGEIIGVRQRGPYFHGVYRYVLPGGGYGEATSVQSRHSLQGLQTGRHVPIQVMADKRDEARERHAPLLWALAIGLLLIGFGLIYAGVTVSKRSPVAWAVMVLVVAFVARWLWRRMKALLAKLKPIAMPEPWSALPIERAESFNASPTLTPRITSTRSKSRRTGMLFVALGLGTFALDYWQAQGLLELMHGIHTSGVVMQLSESSTDKSGDTFLYPVVQYTGQDGSTVSFHDRAGGRPSPFKIGDTVPVRYLPGRPTTAVIDHGLSNWKPVGSLAILGILLTGLGLLALRSR